METLMMWQVIVNIVLVVVTLTYAIFTVIISKSNKKALILMREQIESSERPYIVISHNLRQNTLISLSIKNTGKSAAQGLHLKIDKRFLQIGSKEYNLEEASIFSQPTETYPPGHELTFSLVSTAAIKEGMENDPDTPTKFSITASYSFGSKLLPTETTVVDLRVYNKTFMSPKSVADNLSDVRDSIQSLADSIGKRKRSKK